MLLMAACDGPPPAETRSDADADADADADSDSDSDADADVPVDVTMTGTEAHDSAARPWVGDLTGDGADEIWIGAPWNGYGSYQSHASVYRVDDPVSGPLDDVASLILTGLGPDDLFGFFLVGLPAEGLVGAQGVLQEDDDEHQFYLYAGDLTGTRFGLYTWTARVALPYNDVGHPNSGADCAGVGGHGSLCLGLTGQEFAGIAVMFDGPIVGELSVDDATVRIDGDPGVDNAYVVGAGGDADGDGWNDLAIGAQDRGATGVVALVTDPPLGTSRIWDVAGATFTGEVLYGKLGQHVYFGDLDGDGLVDVYTQQIASRDDAAYVWFSPHTGDRPASDADVTVADSVGPDGTGLGGLVRDLDADGIADLVVGEVGDALVYWGPVRGAYLDDDADVVLRESGDDGFGAWVEAGELDGDGLPDLVIGAGSDDRGGTSAGAVHVVYGVHLQP